MPKSKEYVEDSDSSGSDEASELQYCIFLMK